MTSTAVYSDAIESCFRVIARLKDASAELRERVFQMQAADAFRYAVKAGVEKVQIVDRLDEIAVSFGWSDDDRVRYIAKAVDEVTAPMAADESDQPSDAGIVAKDGADARPPEFSDEALALRHAEQHADLLRYVAAWSKWFIWDGMRWRADDTLAAFDLVRRTCREAAQQCGKRKIATALASGKTEGAVERLAKSDRKIAATAEQWDVDLWLLNTPAGVVNLRTGQTRSHSANDYMTKLSGVAPDAGCATPLWLQFLDRIAAGDADLIAFMQRMAGYALTGSTREHALFFCYGSGANGKSTFLNAVTGCLGDYHKTSPIETFTASSAERHPTDLAGLRGARLVTAVETEEGRRWAESKIKQLTGGDRIAARFMRQDFFEFTPQFKLIVAGNHRPGLRSIDEAIRRRFHLVPFTVTIPPHERDETLGDQLKAEWPGILHWIITGCLEWQERGLAPPASVLSATTAYLDAEDMLAVWIEEAGESDRDAWESSTALYRSWKAWAERAGEYAGSLKKFSQKIEDRADALGMRKARDGQGRRGFQGLRLAVKADLVNSTQEAAE